MSVVCGFCRNEFDSVEQAEAHACKGGLAVWVVIPYMGYEGHSAPVAACATEERAQKLVEIIEKSPGAGSHRIYKVDVL